MRTVRKEDVVRISGEFDPTMVRALNLSGKGITDIGSLVTCTHLERLDLRDNDLSSVSGLGRLDALRELDLSANRLTDLNDVALLSNLRSLNVSKNPLTDLRPLRRLSHLKKLYVDEAHAEDALTLLPRLAVLNGESVRLRNEAKEDDDVEEVKSCTRSSATATTPWFTDADLAEVASDSASASASAFDTTEKLVRREIKLCRAALDEVN